MSSDDWEKLSDEELEKWAQQFQHITRPERIVKSEPKTTRTSNTNTLVQQALNMAAQLGIKPKTK